MFIYCARPISGQSYEQVVGYYRDIVKKLRDVGYDVLYPMLGKSYLRNEIEFKTEGYANPLSTNHAIIERDRWMVKKADIVFLYLSDCGDRVSIGSVMELAWAHDSGKHTIVVMDKNNIHRHAFVLEAADVIFETLAEGIDYLYQFNGKEVKE